MFLSTGLALNLTTPSPLTGRRDLVALLRGPMPTPTQYLGTRDWRRLEQWHVPMLAKLPEPSDAQKNDFGIQESGQFSVDVPMFGAALLVPTLRFDWTTEFLNDRVAGLVPTLTRAGATATRINASGYIEVMAANAPRFDYDPLTLAIKGLLFEESRTNLLLQSNAFGTTWTPVGTPAPTQNLTGPDGAANSAWTITDNDAAAYEAVQQNVAIANDAVTRTFSLLIRKNPGATNTFGLNFGLNGGTPVQATPRFNADTGSLVNSGAVTTFVQGWWGFSQALLNNTSGNNNFYLTIYPATAVWPGADAISGQGSHGIYGAQFEVGAFRTSYIPTGAAAVTRNADSMLIANVTSFYNPTESTVVCEFTLGAAQDAGVWIIYDGTVNNRIDLSKSGGSFVCRIVADGVTQAVITGGNATAGLHRVAFAFAQNSFRASFDGDVPLADFVGTMPVIDRVVLGQSWLGGFLNGHISRFAVYATARPDADLITMSTPGLNLTDFGPPQLLKNQPVDLDLLTRIYREDGSTTDFINERRGFVKSITRRREGLTLNVVDVDRVAMKTLFPINTYTIANWPKLYVDHVSRVIAQGVGLGEKIPLTYVDNTAGAFKYAVCEYPAGSAAPTVLTVYRGKQSGQGQIVPATEYVASSSVVGGLTYLLLTFTREQLDFDNQPFVLEADVNGPGSRLAADEIARVLAAIGLTTDASDFADAAAYHLTINAKVDAWYVKQVPADAIITPLLQVARGWLSQAIGGAYSIAIDRPRTAQRLLWDDSDEVQVDERSEPEVAKTITLRYRPRPAQRSDYAGDLSRTTTGANGEKIFTNEFVRDHDTADRLLDYLAKKELRAAIKASLYGVMLTPGELVAINSPLVFDGWKSLAAESITRVADGCQVVGEEYTESDHSYTPGTLPADATNTYTPDYAYTPPAAPASVTKISDGITVDVDGKGLAYALIRATPPAPSVNWAKLTVQLKNSTTNEVYQAQLVLNGGNYEATIPGLRPNQAHTMLAWATNANGIDGATLAGAGFTSVTYTAAPSAPTGLAISQVAADKIAVSFTPSASGAIVKNYTPYLSVGGGAYTAQPDTDQNPVEIKVTTLAGSSHAVKLKANDRFGNQSADSGIVSLTPASYLTDTHISPLGVGTPSLASQAATDAKVKLTSSTTSGSIGAGATVDFVIPAKATGVRVQQTDAAGHLQMYAASSTTGNGVAVKNIDAVSHNYAFQCYFIDT